MFDYHANNSTRQDDQDKNEFIVLIRRIQAQTHFMINAFEDPHLQYHPDLIRRADELATTMIALRELHESKHHLLSPLPAPFEALGKSYTCGVQAMLDIAHSYCERVQFLAPAPLDSFEFQPSRN